MKKICTSKGGDWYADIREGFLLNFRHRLLNFNIMKARLYLELRHIQDELPELKE